MGSGPGHTPGDPPLPPPKPLPFPTPVGEVSGSCRDDLPSEEEGTRRPLLQHLTPGRAGPVGFSVHLVSEFLPSLEASYEGPTGRGRPHTRTEPTKQKTQVTSRDEKSSPSYPLITFRVRVRLSSLRESNWLEPRRLHSCPYWTRGDVV